MSKSNTYENDLQKFTFNNTAVADIGSSLYLALHTADPGEAGSQTTNEATYTGYARVAVTRNSSGWTVVGNNSTNAEEVLFPTCTSPSDDQVMTHLSIGVNASGASKALYKGALSSDLRVTQNIAPRFLASAINVDED